MPPAAPLSLFAVTAPGLEPVAAEELRALGVADAVAEAGGVAFSGGLERLYEANLQLRTVSRVVARVTEFTARTFFELERHARRVPWEEYLTPGRPVRVRVTCRKSRLYHSDAVAQRILAAIEHRVGSIGLGAIARAGADEAEGEDAQAAEQELAGAQLFTIRFLHDRCTVSADSSGALLHVRGYRQAIAKAPMRETLAAAVLLGAGWRGETPLVDPLCGSGTIAIEGALIARRMAPGIGRRFAFMEWPNFRDRVWASVHDRATTGSAPASPVEIVASDRDAGATTATAANAERAGVGGDIEVRTHALSAIQPPARPGCLATNPPYGVRVGNADELRNLYAAIGQVARAKFPGWTVALLAADRKLANRSGLALRPVFRTSNGGIPVEMLTAVTPGS